MENYKSAKTTKEMVEYLENDKNVIFKEIDKKKAEEYLLRFNYINVITPFKHHFAKKDSKQHVIKVNNKHVYERKIDFSEYYDLYKEERNKYPDIYANISYFETHFKAITSYYIMNYSKDKIETSDDLDCFITKLKTNIALLGQYKPERKVHMNKHIEELREDIPNYHDVYCYFDRLSLGHLLTVFIGLDVNMQNNIFNCLVKYGMNLGVGNVSHFIEKVFTLIGIRNCIMHNNSLEVLVRFFNPKTKDLRKVSDKKKYESLISELSKEKQPL